MHDAIQFFNILKELLVSFVFWLRQICVGAKQNDLYMASNNLFRCLKFVKMEREMRLLLLLCAMYVTQYFQIMIF